MVKFVDSRLISFLVVLGLDVDCLGWCFGGSFFSVDYNDDDDERNIN